MQLAVIIVKFLQGAKIIAHLFFCVQHAAVIPGIPTYWNAWNYCSVLHAKIACNTCTRNHGISGKRIA